MRGQFYFGYISIHTQRIDPLLVFIRVLKFPHHFRPLEWPMLGLIMPAGQMFPDVYRIGKGDHSTFRRNCYLKPCLPVFLPEHSTGVICLPQLIMPAGRITGAVIHCCYLGGVRCLFIMWLTLSQRIRGAQQDCASIGLFILHREVLG